jgi:hypothetical protein
MTPTTPAPDIDPATVTIQGYDRTTGTWLELEEYHPDSNEKMEALTPRNWRWEYFLIILLPFVAFLLHRVIGELWHYDTENRAMTIVDGGVDKVIDTPYKLAAADFAGEYYGGLTAAVAIIGILIAVGVIIRKTTKTLTGIFIALALIVPSVALTVYLSSRADDYSIRAFWTGACVGLAGALCAFAVLYHVAHRFQQYLRVR